MGIGRRNSLRLIEFPSSLHSDPLEESLQFDRSNFPFTNKIELIDEIKPPFTNLDFKYQRFSSKGIEVKQICNRKDDIIEINSSKQSIKPLNAFDANVSLSKSFYVDPLFHGAPMKQNTPKTERSYDITKNKPIIMKNKDFSLNKNNKAKVDTVNKSKLVDTSKTSLYMLLLLLPSVGAFTPLNKFAVVDSTSFMLSNAVNTMQAMDSGTLDTLKKFSSIALDVEASAINPEPTMGVRLIDSLGQIFGLMSYWSANQCIEPDEVTYHLFKTILTVFFLIKSVLPIMSTLLHYASQFELNMSSSLDKSVYEEVFQPVGLTWLSYNTLKANGGVEWIDLNSREKVNVKKDIGEHSRSNIKDLTKAFLNNDVYWLCQGEVNVVNGEETILKQSRYDGSSCGLVLTSGLFNKDTNGKLQIKAGDDGAKILRINSDKVSKLIEDDSKLRSCMQSLAFVGACHEMEQSLLKLSTV